MKTHLTISERLYLIRMMDAFKGSMEVLSDILEDVKEVRITEEDWEKAEKKEQKLDNGTIQWMWNDEKAGEKAIELNKSVIDYSIGVLNDKSKKGELTIEDKSAITLLAKLKKA